MPREPEVSGVRASLNDAAVAALATRVKAAAESAMPLQICGGGSKAFYGRAIQGELLDTRERLCGYSLRLAAR